MRTVFLVSFFLCAQIPLSAQEIVWHHSEGLASSAQEIIWDDPEGLALPPQDVPLVFPTDLDDENLLFWNEFEEFYRSLALTCVHRAIANSVYLYDGPIAQFRFQSGCENAVSAGCPRLTYIIALQKKQADGSFVQVDYRRWDSNGGVACGQYASGQFNWQKEVLPSTNPKTFVDESDAGVRSRFNPGYYRWAGFVYNTSDISGASPNYSAFYVPIAIREKDLTNPPGP